MFLDTLRDIFGLDGVSDNKKLRLAEIETKKVIAAEEAMEFERAKLLHQRFEGVDVERDVLDAFTLEDTIDLGVARKNKVLYNRPFKAFTVTELSPKVVKPATQGEQGPVAYLRFNSPAGPTHRVRSGEIKGNFHRVYLTNAAQAGDSFSFVITTTATAHYGMRGDTTALIEALELIKGAATKKTLADLYTLGDVLVQRATTPYLYSVNMNIENTEYEQQLAMGTKMIHFHLVDFSAYRYAWSTGKVATPTDHYHAVLANHDEERRGLNLSDKTLYFASSTASKKMQIEAIV